MGISKGYGLFNSIPGIKESQGQCRNDPRYTKRDTDVPKAVPMVGSVYSCGLNTSLGIASKPRSIMKTGKVEKIPGKMTAQGYPIDRIDVEPDNWEPL